MLEGMALCTSSLLRDGERGRAGQPLIEFSFVEPQRPADSTNRQSVLTNVVIERAEGRQAEIRDGLVACEVRRLDRARLIDDIEAALRAHDASASLCDGERTMYRLTGRPMILARMRAVFCVCTSPERKR